MSGNKDSAQLSSQFLALLRHGEYLQPEGVPSAHLPYALSQQGRLQAKSSVNKLKAFAEQYQLEINPTIDSSPLRRAWETADIIKDAIERLQHINEINELCERSMGAMANLSVDRIENILAEDPRYDTPPLGWKRNSYFKLPFVGCESLMEAGQRVAQHILNTVYELQQNNKSSLKIMIGHGGAIRHAAVNLGLISVEKTTEISMYHCEPIYFEFKSDGQIHQHGEWKKRQLEETTYD